MTYEGLMNRIMLANLRWIQNHISRKKKIYQPHEIGRSRYLIKTTQIFYFNQLRFNRLKKMSR